MYCIVLSQFRQIMKKLPKQILYINEGVDFYNNGQYDEAVHSYDQAIAADPGLSIAWLYRGTALNELERHEEAIESFDKALETDSDSYIAWNSRGLALDQLERNDEAIESYDRALEINPDDNEVRENREQFLMEKSATR